MTSSKDRVHSQTRQCRLQRHFICTQHWFLLKDGTRYGLDDGYQPDPLLFDWVFTDPDPGPIFTVAFPSFPLFAAGLISDHE